MEPREEYNLQMPADDPVDRVEEEDIEIKRRRLREQVVVDDLLNRSEQEEKGRPREGRGRRGGVTIDDLPNGCLLRILSYINCVREKGRMGRVCKRWQDLVTISRDCHHQNVTQPEHLFYEKEIRSLRKKVEGSQVEAEINGDVKQNAKTTAYVLLNVLRKCPKLRTINMTRITRSLGLELSLKDLIEKLKLFEEVYFGIKYLSLSNLCSTTCDEELTAFLEKCPVLDKLEIYGCIELRGQFLEGIGDNLRCLDVCDNYAQIDGKYMVTFLKDKGSRLTSFSLSNNCFRHVDDIRDILSAVTSNCLNLEVFILNILDHLEINLTALSKLTLLKDLDITCQVNCFGDDTFLRIIESCPNLRHLGLSYQPHMELMPHFEAISDESLSRLPIHCPLLKSLGLWNTTGITESGVDHLVGLKELETFSFEKYTCFPTVVIDMVTALEPIKEIIRSRLDHSEKLNFCPHCDRQFVNAISLRIHLRTHKGEAPYFCKLCPSQFPDSGRLWAHAVSHVRKSFYECYNCLGRFRQRHDLVHHNCL